MATFVQPPIGSLRHVLVIESITSQTFDANNESTPVYSTVGNRRASIDATNSETLSLNQAATRANLSHFTIKMRYFPGLGVNHRIRFGNFNLDDLSAEQFAALSSADYAALAAEGEAPQYYRIKSVTDPDYRGRWTVVEVVQGSG